jgi:hypothetical protein
MIALVLHLSSRDYGGRRIVDEVRKSLVRFVCTTESEDGFYLYHPQVLEPVYSQGEKTAALGNFETDGYKFDLGFALKQSLYVAARNGDSYIDKVLLLVTDSFVSTDLPSVKKVVVLNEKEDLECKVLVVGIGNRYDADTLSAFASQTPALAYLHAVPGELDVVLQKWFEERVSEESGDWLGSQLREDNSLKE